MLKGIKWHFIELPKFRRSNPDMNEKLNQWLAIIDDSDKGMIKMAEEKNDTMKKARVEMNYLTGDEEVRRLAELREKWEMDRVSAINYATKKGEERGEQRGEKRGEQRGEKKKSLEIAKEMKNKGIDIELIQEITKLTKEEIEKM